MAEAALSIVTILNQGITVLISLLQLKYQGYGPSNATLFSTHPATMLIAASSFAVYCFSNTALLRFPRFAAIAHHCLVCSAHMLFASLAPLLFPDDLQPFAYAVYGLVAAMGLLSWLYDKLFAVFLVRLSKVLRFLIANIWSNSSGRAPAIDTPNLNEETEEF